jgi:hypothetical protein
MGKLMYLKTGLWLISHVFFLRQALQLSDNIEDTMVRWKQGDQIGRIFGYRVIADFGQIFENFIKKNFCTNLSHRISIA